MTATVEVPLATAADFDILDPAPIVDTAFDWSGGYLGGSLGGHGVTATSPSLGTIAGPGLLAGVFAGFNAQTDGFVYGVEGDAEYSGFNKTVPCPGPGWSCNGYINAMGSLRGRLGYAVGNMLVYGTAGPAVASIGGSTSNGVTYPDRQIRLGWTAGAGLEAGLANNWSVRAEYRYADLGTADMHFDVTYPAVHVTSQAFRLGVAYHF